MARWLSSDSRGGVPDLPWLTRGSLTSCTSCPQARQPSKPKCRRKEIAQGNFPILVAYTHAIGSHTKVYLACLVLCSSLPQEIKLHPCRVPRSPMHYHPPCRLLHLLLATIYKPVCCVFLCRRSKLHPCRGPRSQLAAAAVTAAATRAAGAAASAAC